MAFQSQLKEKSHPVGWLFCCGLVGIRTPNLLIRSQMLYPIELRNQ